MNKSTDKRTNKRTNKKLNKGLNIIGVVLLVTIIIVAAAKPQNNDYKKEASSNDDLQNQISEENINIVDNNAEDIDNVEKSENHKNSENDVLADNDLSNNNETTDKADIDNNDIIDNNAKMLDEKCAGSGYIAATLVNSFDLSNIKEVKTAVCIDKRTESYDITLQTENNKIYHITYANGNVKSIDEIH